MKFKEISEVIKKNKINLDNKIKKVFYRQSGVRTTQAIFALYLAGEDPAELLNSDDSWIGYSYNKILPVIDESH